MIWTWYEHDMKMIWTWYKIIASISSDRPSRLRFWPDAALRKSTSMWVSWSIGGRRDGGMARWVDHGGSGLAEAVDLWGQVMIAWIGNVVSWQSTSTRQHSPALASTRRSQYAALSRCSYTQPRSLEQCSVSWRVRMSLLVLLGKIWYRSTCIEMSYHRKYQEEYEVSWHIAMWPMASLRHTNGQVPARTYPSTAILQRI